MSRLVCSSSALHHVSVVDTAPRGLAPASDPDEIPRLRSDFLGDGVCGLDVGELRRRGVESRAHLVRFLLGQELVLGNQEVCAYLERRDFFLDLLPSDDLLSCNYAVLPPLTIRSKWHEQYTEQGPIERRFLSRI